MKISAISLILLFAALQSSLASAPVRKTIVGCVSNGVFKSENGYIIKIRERPGKLLDLSQWRGKRLQITGSLLPADNFYPTSAPVVLGPCR